MVRARRGAPSEEVAVSVEPYLAFVAASAALIMVPGPNVALIVANSVAGIVNLA